MPHPDPPKRDLYEHTHGRKVGPALSKCYIRLSVDGCQVFYVWDLGVKSLSTEYLSFDLSGQK